MAAAGGLAVRDAQRLLDAAIVAARALARGVQGLDRAVRRAPARRAPASGRAARRGAAARAARGQRGRGQPRRLRARAGPLHAALRAAGARRGRRRARPTSRPRSSASSTPSPTTRSSSPTDGDVVAGGNFHGQPLSLPLDHLALALCELASFSERRTYALLSPSYAGLPAFLSPRPGLSSGLMIAQYAAAALVNECQVLAASGRRRLDPDLGGPGGLQLDGRARGAQGAHGGRELRAGHRHRARVRLPGPRVPPPAAHHAARSRRAWSRCARSCRASRRTASLSGELGGAGRRRCGPGRSCCEVPGLGAGGRAADAREQPASRRGRAPAGPRRLRRDRQGRARPRVAARRSSASCSASAAPRRCSCSRASRWPCSRRTPTRRAC